MSAITSYLPSSQLATISLKKIGNSLAPYVFKAASYLTDPICKTHEFYRKLYVVDILNSTAHRVTNYIRKLLLIIGIVGFAFLAALTTLPGGVLRYVGIHMQEKPFLHFKGDRAQQPFKGNQFTHLGWNIMALGGGYCFTDGGVLPWPLRMDRIVKEVREKNPDVACFYELFDLKASFELYQKLKGDYAHFYFNVGPRVRGPNSGLFIASKFPLENPEFLPFPKEMLVGRTKFCEKGVFSCNIENEKKERVYIFSTHLQHSEECDFPTGEEKLARMKEMELIQKKVDAVKDRGLVVLTGDMNCDDAEFDRSIWKNSKRVRFLDAKTWGGDQFCAELVKKRISGPLNLDYTCIAEGPHQGDIQTTLIKTGFSGAEFRKEALSDHEGLYSVIRLR